MSSEILGFTKEGKAIRPIKPGMIATAAVISCEVCHTMIRGMGGPSHGARCLEHASKRVLLDKQYSAEELSDLGRDAEEAFNEDFTPEAAGIPKDEHGFDKGTFKVSITWIAEGEE